MLLHPDMDKDMPKDTRCVPQKSNQYLCQKRCKNSSKAEFGAEEPVVALFSPQFICIICNASPGLPLAFFFFSNISVFCEVTLTYTELK